MSRDSANQNHCTTYVSRILALLGAYVLIDIARTGEEEIAEMPVELYMLDKLKARIQLAREIDSVQHKAKKEKHERNWLKETAEAMEIELDSDLAR